MPGLVRRCIRLCVAASVCGSLMCAPLFMLPAFAADAAPDTEPSPVAHPLAQLFAHPVVLRGTLDGAQIQMELHLKQGESGVLEGSYFVFGHSQKILLAGEFEEDALSMEESVNGQDVSGLWDGAYDGTALTGNWSTTDGAVLHPFVLKVVPTGQN